MRQMAGDGQHHVVMVGRHDLDLGAKSGPERAQFFHRRGIGALGRRENAPAIDEQFSETGIRTGVLGTGDGMRRNELRACRQMRLHVPHHRAFDRADIGHNRAGLEVRRDLLRHGATGADGNAEDDEVGIPDRFSIAFHHAVDDTEFGDARARLRRTCGRDDLPGEALRPRGARDRAADQAEADQRNLFEYRAGLHLPAMKARKASSTSRLASSVPMVRRSACGSW